MTERLYYADAYLTDFEATVVARDTAARRLYLDRTAFYPTSGGQEHDLGSITLSTSRVVATTPGSGSSPPALLLSDVVDEGERIAHVLAPGDAPLPEVGSTLSGHVDFARRFDHMQQHTGQHLLSAVFQDLCGCSTLSVHFGELTSTVDLDTAELTTSDVERVEQAANAHVFADREVTQSFEDAAEASGLRKASARSGLLRIVHIAGLDRSACGGTHVRRTGELGAILLRKVERVRKGVRVEFVCGGRARRRARADYLALARVGGLLSAGLDEVPALVESRIADLKKQSGQLDKLRAELAAYRARELLGAAEHRTAAGSRWAVERLGSGSLDELQPLARAFTASSKAVLIGVLESPPSVLLATSEDSGVDARALATEGVALHAGRGGGSPRLARGTFGDRAALERFVAWLEARLAG